MSKSMKNWSEIERFITENRPLLDIEEPDSRVWESLQKKLDRKANTNISFENVYKAVAAVALIATVGIGSYQLGKSNRNLMQVADIAQPDWEILLPKSQADSEIQEIETYYAMQIGDRYDELKQYNLSQYDFSKEFLGEMKKVEEAYMEVKADLNSDGYNERLIQGMVATYEARIRILTQLLDRIQEQNQQALPKQKKTKPAKL